jgi:hypothetical protein
MKHEIEPTIPGPRKTTDPIAQLEAPDYAAADLKKAVAAFSKKRLEVLTARASALDVLDEAMTAITAGRFSHKNLPSIEKAKADLLVADAEEINSCRVRTELHKQFELANRTERERIQNLIDARREEICEQSEAAEESPLVLDARIRTDKKIQALIESAPPELDIRGVNLAAGDTEQRREFLDAKIRRALSI